MKIEIAHGTPVLDPFKNSKGVLKAEVSFASFMDTTALGTPGGITGGEDGESDLEDNGLSAKDKNSSKSILDEFAKWAHMTPAERIRAQYLEAHGMSEADVSHLPPEVRQAIEDEIKKQIEEQTREQAASNNGPAAV